MSVFEREKRQEQARIGELRGLLERVDKPGFWDRLSKSVPSSDKADSFQQAVLKRAHELGVTPQTLLTVYGRGLSTSAYPTADCLEAEETQAIVSGQPSAKQAAHLEVCEPCRQLLAACRVDPDELRARLATIRQAGAEAEQEDFYGAAAGEEVREVNSQSARASFTDYLQRKVTR